jgi:hypothetical protein
MRGALRQHQLAGGPHLSLQQVTAVRCAIAFAYHDMGMNLWLTIFQSHIADQRKQFDLLVQRNGRLVFLCFPVEPPELDG